jgi:four helix bundle protein
MKEGNVEQKPKGFRNLNVWQKAYALTLDIYRATKTFPKAETYGMISQLQRAAVSVPANIAEGYERNYRKEYVQFLFISKGSLGEVETFLLLARDLGYLSNEDYAAIEEKRGETTRLLRGLIKSLLPS